LIGGVTLDAAASFEVASTAAPALSGPIARIDYRRGRGKRIAGDYPRLVAVNAEQRTMRRVVWSLWLLVGGLAIAAVAVYLATRGSDQATAPVVPVSSEAAATWPALRKPAPAFSLRDEDGRAFSLASLRGKPVVVTFIDPLCRDYCPTEARRLSDASAALPPGQRPTIVAVSVNPYGNARHVLRQDRMKWRLASNWRWGVADEPTLADVWKAYHVDVLVQTKKIAGVEMHQIGHTEAAYVIDRSGYQRALFLWPYDSTGVVRALRGLAAAS
jgi:cytochrome oxidase Cu insertion factor (SCO1/SenC/PrrC family)